MSTDVRTMTSHVRFVPIAEVATAIRRRVSDIRNRPPSREVVCQRVAPARLAARVQQAESQPHCQAK
jgi:hypothetical protein